MTVEPPAPQRRGPVDGSPNIFVSDPSAEADRLSTALRARGYAVFDVPLSLLMTRVAVQRPALILLDIDAEAALETAQRLRELPGGTTIPLIFLGDPARTLAACGEALRRVGAAVFARPIEVPSVIEKVEALASPSLGQLDPEQLSNNGPPAPDNLSSAPAASYSSLPPLPPRAHSSVPAPLGPGLERARPASLASQPAQLPLPSLSPDVEQLLQMAEQQQAGEGALLSPARTAPSHPPSSPPSPEEEVDAVLPAEILSALDEPLVDDQDEIDSESDLATGGKRKSTSVDSGTSAGRSQAQSAADLSAAGIASSRHSVGDAPSPQATAHSVGAAALQASVGSMPLTSSSRSVRNRPVDTSGGPEHTPITTRERPPAASATASTEAEFPSVEPGPLHGVPGATSFRSEPDASRRGPLISLTPPEALPPARRRSDPQASLPDSGLPVVRKSPLATSTPSALQTPLPLPAPPPLPSLTPRLLQTYQNLPSAPFLPSTTTPGAAPGSIPGANPANVQTSGGAHADAPPTGQRPAADWTNSGRERAEGRHDTTRPPPQTRDTNRPPPHTHDTSRPPRARDTSRPPPRARDTSPPPRARDTSRPPAPASSPGIPEVLGPGDAIRAVAMCIQQRATGSICIDSAEGVRRILLRDGDVVTASSGIDEESLVGFLAARGDIPREVVSQLLGKIPAFGRLAASALSAKGHITQDQLWPVLRAHAEWIVGNALLTQKGTAAFELEPPGRLKAEPPVFGGATGSETLVEVVKRVIPPSVAMSRIGGSTSILVEGSRSELLSECALSDPVLHWLERSKGASLAEVLADAPVGDSEPILYALIELGILTVVQGDDGLPEAPATDQSRGGAPSADPLDAQALRTQVATRLQLIQEADYFTLLGVPRSATSYEVHRAYLDLRRTFSPGRALTSATADLADDLQLILEVLDEAHDVLRDTVRRERYRRAIEGEPPQ